MSTSTKTGRRTRKSTSFPTGKEFPLFVERLRNLFVQVASKGSRGTSNPKIMQQYLDCCQMVMRLEKAPEGDRRQMQCLVKLPATATKPERQYTINWKSLREVLNNEAPTRADILNAKAEFSL
jgi:hypothetical protein